MGKSNGDASCGKKDLNEALQEEIKEIEKYKWYMGEKLRRDPLTDRSMNDIAREWIEQHAAEFRSSWTVKKKKSGNKPPAN